jgi:hypothetical protein
MHPRAFGYVESMTMQRQQPRTGSIFAIRHLASHDE